MLKDEILGITMALALIVAPSEPVKKPIATPVKPETVAASSASTSKIPVTPLVAKVVNPALVNFTDVKVGSGLEAKAGFRVTVHLLIRGDGGAVRTDTARRGLPYTFVVGSSEAVLSELVLGMRPGGVRMSTRSSLEPASPEYTITLVKVEKSV